MLKQTGVVLGLGLALMAGAWAQGVNPPVATNLPPPASNNSTTYGGASELFGGFAMQYAKATTANSTTVSTTNVAAVQLGYRYHINDWNAVEVRLSVSEPTQVYASAITVKSFAEEASLDYVFTLPTDGSVRPFLMAGMGRIHYVPTGDANTPGALSDWKFEMNYGGGLDFKLTKISSRLSLRVEYRGLFYKVPDFQFIGINKWNHLPEPDLALVLHF